MVSVNACVGISNEALENKVVKAAIGFIQNILEENPSHEISKHLRGDARYFLKKYSLPEKEKGE
jgi:hypothetical protein